MVIDSPHGNGYTGGAVSAPIFKRIAEAALTYLGIGAERSIAPPPVVVVRHDPNDEAPGVKKATNTEIDTPRPDALPAAA